MNVVTDIDSLKKTDGPGRELEPAAVDYLATLANDLERRQTEVQNAKSDVRSLIYIKRKILAPALREISELEQRIVELNMESEEVKKKKATVRALYLGGPVRKLPAEVLISFSWPLVA
ncbi:hypothetical protein L218DRAFT_1009780 [Marasmius fiardii PR-910]|nr:hypothetical protein L218DRAFT_1009780 [Marasmius fiardii PR-910]